MNLINGAGENDSHFILCYGASGTGKTHLAGTLGEIGTVLVIDIDQGYKTLRKAADLQKYSDNIWICDFKQFKDLNTAAQLVEANNVDKWSKAFGVSVDELPANGFDWVVWDTWSEVQWYMMSELRRKESLTGTGLDFRKNIGIQHWGMMTDLNKLSIETLRNCDTNQIMLMQETMMKDDLSGAIHGGPAIHGKLVQEMPAYFDVVIHTETDITGNYIASTKRKGLWPAKTRLGVGTVYKNPTMKQILFL